MAIYLLFRISMVNFILYVLNTNDVDDRRPHRLRFRRPPHHLLLHRPVAAAALAASALAPSIAAATLTASTLAATLATSTIAATELAVKFFTPIDLARSPNRRKALRRFGDLAVNIHTSISLDLRTASGNWLGIYRKGLHLVTGPYLYTRAP